MYNSNHLPNNQISTQVFYANSDLQVWRKPQGAHIIHIVCIGAGGGGGSGASRASGTASGGAGGGSAGISRMTIDGFICPGYLNIYVAAGGLGGDLSAGQDGERSYIAIPEANNGYGGSLLIQSGNLSAGGGAFGTVSIASSTAGAASTVFAPPTFGSLGTWISIAGQAGSAGGANGTLGAAVAWGSLFISGGAGGGGITNANVNSAGGNITQPGNAIFQTITGGAAGGGQGKPGVDILGKPPIFSGGSGGGSNAAGTGGAGGKSGVGSGGGGGGAGITGGVGGNGGNGLIIITCI